MASLIEIAVGMIWLGFFVLVGWFIMRSEKPFWVSLREVITGFFGILKSAYKLFSYMLGGKQGG